jgi:TonB family C-terminal domain
MGRGIMGSALQRDPAVNPAVNDSHPSMGADRESLVALTKDAELIETLRAVASDHQLSIVDDQTDLASYLIRDRAGVAILDAAAVTSPLPELTQRLKSQFPELVLIVAGGAEDQSAIAAQLTSGTVYRFLHKPVSGQRVKLFVDAAWRRHDEEHANTIAGADPYRGQPSSRFPVPVLVAGAAGVAFVVALVVWFTGGETDTGPAAVSPVTAQPADPQLEELLARADAALEHGSLAGPGDGDRAADLFRQVLERDAGNLRAREGLDKVIDRLLTAAEQALLAERLDEAERLTETARGVQPDHVRVAFLTAQIGKERERAALLQAREAAARGNLQRALALLDGAAREGQDSSLVAETRVALEQRQVEDRVRDMLRRAAELMASGALVEPARSNARFFIESARTIAPQDPQVLAAQRDLIERIIAKARTALEAGNAEEGERWAAAARESGASSAAVESLQREVQRVRMVAQAEELARLSQLFNERLARNQLLEPWGDSAKFYLTSLVESDADHPSTLLARQLLGTRLIEEARGALARGDFADVQRWIAEAREVGAPQATLVAIERELDTARTQLQPQSQPRQDVVSAAALERVRYVAPVYPQVARERGVEGWVELMFTVRTDGSVADVVVTESEPSGTFDRAAIDALRRWRYRPMEVDGRPVEQRARIRLRFELNE